jgi:hypothetical protein
VILVVLYGNIAAMLNIWSIGFPKEVLPRIPFVGNLFYMHGVFLSVGRESKEYLAFGVPHRLMQPPEVPVPGMTQLDLSQYFPQSLGEVDQRISLSGFRFRAEARRQGFIVLCERLKQLHNAAHPDEQRVAQVYLYLSTWPADAPGYRYRYAERRVRLLPCH